MVEPQFRLPAGAAEPVAGLTLVLTGDEAKHAISAKRMRPGEPLVLSDGRGLRARAVVQQVLARELLVSVTEVQRLAAPTLQITLVQALAKGDRDELAIQAATELGVWQVVPWQAERSVSRWDETKAAKGVARWQTIVGEAAKQSLRAFEPTVLPPLDSAALGASLGGYHAALLLDPTADLGLGAWQPPAPGAEPLRIAVIVGPEGGVSAAELVALGASGAIRIRLGGEILRTSTAGVAAIAALLHKMGHWN